MKLTLSVHKVGNGNGVATLNTGDVGSKGVIGSVLGASSTHVLLTEALEVVLNGVHSLQIVLESFNGARINGIQSVVPAGRQEEPC